VTIPTNADGDGENMLKAFKGEAMQRTRPVFWRTNGDKKAQDFWPDLAVREGDWKLVTTFDGQRVELHNLKSNRGEDGAKDQSKDNPEMTARLTALVLDWKATLPTKADPSCLENPQKQAPEKLLEKSEPKSEASAKARTIPFNRWDTNKDEFLSLEEYKAGQNGAAGLEGRFKRLDKDDDGKISRKEFVTPAVKEHQRPAAGAGGQASVTERTTQEPL
jgi:hypothetical protein